MMYWNVSIVSGMRLVRAENSAFVQGAVRLRTGCPAARFGGARARLLYLLLALGVNMPMLASPASLFAQSSGMGQELRNGGGEALHPGDVIRLRIWREPEWSGDFRVDEAGMVVLPKIGPLRVTDEAPAVLKAWLAETYRGHLSHASVDVVLLRRVQVLGAVRSPGLYDVDPAMRVSDVLALAGGATTQGNLKRIRLVRGGHTVAANLAQESAAGATALRSGDQIFVPERGWLSRNPGVVAAILSTTVSLTLALLR